MIDFTPGEEFLVAVQRRYKQHELINARGLKGRIVEPISKQDYQEVWEWRGCNSEGLSEHPQFFYRCAKLPSDKPPLASVPASDEPLRGDQESAL